MNDQIHEPDDADSFMDMPAIDGILGHVGLGMEKFAGLPSPTAMAQLHAAGIGLKQRDLIVLFAALRTLHGFPNLHFSKEEVERETRIRKLSTELRELLEVDAGRDDGWRVFWGHADWSEFDDTLDAPEPEWSTDVSSVREELDYLAKGACERIEWLASTKTSGLEPGSNRAPRIRYFYWLLLIAFWKYRLGRDVATCTNNEGKASGPLIRFLQIMSEGGMGPEQIEGQTVRAFVRGNAGREDRYAEFFATR